MQLIIAGAQVVGRAFNRALREELAASQEAAKRRAAASSSSSSNSSFRSNAESVEDDLRYKITLDEAIQILNVHKKLDPKEVDEKFRHLFSVNEKSKGGSFYLQSKVVRAKERIDLELEKSTSSNGESGKTSKDGK